MRAVRHPEVRGGGHYFIARVRDSQAHFLFAGAVLGGDNLWVTLLDAYDPVAGDNEVCAIDVRVVDLLTVTMNRAEQLSTHYPVDDRPACTCGEDDGGGPALPHKTWCPKAQENRS